MFRKIIYIFVIFYFFYISVANALLEIDKKNKVILDYSNNITLEKLVNTWALKLYLINSNWIEIINDTKNKMFVFNIKWGFYYKKWQFYVYLNKKVSVVDYIINLKSDKVVFDISSKLKLKRIQDRPLSCESSATADIISYFTQRDINEYDIYNLMEKDFDTLPSKDWKKILWWNPNKWFVWNINYYWDGDKIKPSQAKMTWYWVYEKPVKKVYDKYFIKTSIINSNNHSYAFSPADHLNLILKNLKKWNMVQLWWDWCTKTEFEDWTINSQEYTQKDANNLKTWKNTCWDIDRDRTLTWYYKENWKLKKQNWLAWEHAFYLLWYEWDINNPSKIIVWDTYTGYHKYNTKEWMRKWSAMDYRTIIAYKPVKNYFTYSNNLAYNK